MTRAIGHLRPIIEYQQKSKRFFTGFDIMPWSLMSKESMLSQRQ
jgi:hypothetical protein